MSAARGAGRPSGGEGTTSAAVPVPAPAETGQTFVVDHATTGLRLDQFVADRTATSTAAARRMIDAGLVRVANRPAPKGARLVAGTVVEIAPHPRAATLPILPDTTIAVVVVYEDDDLVAIDKPGGLPSHPLRADERGTAANGIVARFPSCAAASPDPREGGLGHRLDTATSGVLIAARSREAWAGLRRALGAGDCEKRYLCEVWGFPPDAGKTDLDIGRRGRRGHVVQVGGGGRHPQSAVTTWRVLARRPATALVEARLHAGRAHQVRAHMAAAGFPIVGDDRYGGVRGSPPSSSGPPPRLHLHAAAVRFRHPTTENTVVIEAPPPDWAVVADDHSQTGKG